MSQEMGVCVQYGNWNFLRKMVVFCVFIVMLCDVDDQLDDDDEVDEFKFFFDYSEIMVLVLIFLSGEFMLFYFVFIW